MNLKYDTVKRILDLLMVVVASLVLIPIFIVLYLVVKLTSRGPALYWSERVGKDNETFQMPKFRTMSINTPEVATHLLEKPADFLTPVGAFLRASSLDELPQLWCIIIGHMSLVGPRPALHNQIDLVKLRTKNNVHLLRPGLTGLAQISGRDTISIAEKVEIDKLYLLSRSVKLDFQIILKTIVKTVGSQDVSH